MSGVREDITYQIMEHLRALRADVTALRAQVDGLERRLAETSPAAKPRQP